MGVRELPATLSSSSRTPPLEPIGVALHPQGSPIESVLTGAESHHNPAAEESHAWACLTNSPSTGREERCVVMGVTRLLC